MTQIRYFSDDSIWNQKLAQEPVFSENNDRYVRFLKKSQKQAGFHINASKWATPIFYADANTPRVPVEQRLPEHFGEGRFMYQHSKYLTADAPEIRSGHASNFGKEVPIPQDAVPDGMTDGHMTIIDRSSNTAWDFWGAGKREDGSWWCCSGISYSIDGPGTFDPTDFPIKNGESIHLFGPTRASGVPNLAGTIRHDEILAGKIEHKLAFATRYAGLLEHVPPAIWTDGGIQGGIPEGIQIQLDPELNLDSLGLSDSGKVIATALQDYGAICVDVALGSVLAAEGLSESSDKSWEGLLEEDSLSNLPFDHFRFIKPDKVIERGMIPSLHPIIFQTYQEAMQLHPEVTIPGQGTFIGWPKDWHAQLVRSIDQK